MGWTFCRSHKGPEDVRRAETSAAHWGKGFKVLASAWGYEGVDPDGERGLFMAVERTDNGEQFIAVFLVAKHPNGYGWGYKDMDESMGPYRNDCPPMILRLASKKPSRHANHEWRAKARLRISAESAANRVRMHRAEQMDFGGAFDGFTVTSDADPGL